MHNPVLAEVKNEHVFIKKHNYFILSNSPLLLKCGNCNNWYEIINTKQGFDMIKKTPIEAIRLIGHICEQCGHSYKPNSIIKGFCPKCGSINIYANLLTKQNR
jgi:Zn finger protein HypA/HybF involved in hydrogenase expression